MNKLLMKQTGVLAFILGLLCGILVLLPIVGILAFLTVVAGASIAILIYMKKRELIGILDPKQAALYGTFIGFVAYVGFSVTMIPLSIILGWINSISLHKLVWFSFIQMALLMGFGGIFMMIMIVVFLALMSAMFNAFNAMLVVYVMQQIENPSGSRDKFKIDMNIDD